MAEFIEVMRNADRMCKTAGYCSKCPLMDDGGCIRAHTVSALCADKFEKIVTDWAKAHPEPVYPSWEEGWKQLFPRGEMQCPNDLFDAHITCTVGCTMCKTRPMLPSVAEKLGIKPKEV